jgi:hypothetical protein
MRLEGQLLSLGAAGKIASPKVAMNPLHVKSYSIV